MTASVAAASSLPSHQHDNLAWFCNYTGRITPQVLAEGEALLQLHDRGDNRKKILGRLSSLYVMVGNYERSLHHETTLLEMTSYLSDPEKYVACLLNIADRHRLLHNWVSAWQNLETAYAIASNLPIHYPHLMGSFYHLAAVLHIERHAGYYNPQQSVRYSEHACDEYEKIDFPISSFDNRLPINFLDRAFFNRFHLLKTYVSAGLYSQAQDQIEKIFQRNHSQENIAKLKEYWDRQFTIRQKVNILARSVVRFVDRTPVEAKAFVATVIVGASFYVFGPFQR